MNLETNKSVLIRLIRVIRVPIIFFVQRTLRAKQNHSSDDISRKERKEKTRKGAKKEFPYSRSEYYPF